jgi:hypothetical protein
MNIPGFSAEASLGKTERYRLTLEQAAEAGGVLPQFCFRSPGSNYVTCGECVDTDGDGVPDTCWTYTRPLAQTLF